MFEGLRANSLNLDIAGLQNTLDPDSVGQTAGTKLVVVDKKRLTASSRRSPQLAGASSYLRLPLGAVDNASSLGPLAAAGTPFCDCRPCRMFQGATLLPEWQVQKPNAAGSSTIRLIVARLTFSSPELLCCVRHLMELLNCAQRYKGYLRSLEAQAWKPFHWFGDRGRDGSWVWQHVASEKKRARRGESGRKCGI